MTDLSALSFECKCGGPTECALEFEIQEVPGRIDVPMCRRCWRDVPPELRAHKPYVTALLCPRWPLLSEVERGRLEVVYL